MEDVDAIEEERSQEEKEQVHEVDQPRIYNGLKCKKLSWKNLVRLDSFDLEANRFTSNLAPGSSQLAFQSIGVVYGDLGTSPLYVLPGIFPTGVKHNDDILGVLSLIFYLLMLISLIKYVFIVLIANDDGDGTFALYSLICRYAKVSLMPNQQAEDKEVSNYRLDVPNLQLKRASFIKSMLESNQILKYFILFMTMLGTSMVIGDGILTLCISAVGEVKEASALTDNTIMWISVAILIILFQTQRFGTNKIGYSFAPVLTIWFLFIGTIGMYNFVNMIQGLSRQSIQCSEALFADLGHFIVCSIQISSCTIVFPFIVLAYFGQASYLWKHNQDATNAFYSSPKFIVAVMAAIIASQLLISASFSIIQKSLALGCFPRVKVLHTSAKYKGQVYVPKINTLLMLACVGVTLGFKNTLKIGNAYGIAVAFVFTITSSFLRLVMVMIWKTNIYLIIIYALTIGLLEFLFLSSVLYKFVDGGYLPLLFSLTLVTIMYLWNYGCQKKYKYELENKVSTRKLVEAASNPSIHRVLGVALFYTERVHGISPIFAHYVANVPALHSVLVFVSIKYLTISTVPPEERFSFGRMEPHELGIFRCVLRYGYKDSRFECEFFKEMLVNQLKEFIRNDLIKPNELVDNNEVEKVDEEMVQREVGIVDDALKFGDVVYLMGENEMMASKGSSFLKKLAINYAYNWLKRCVRQAYEVFMIPRNRLPKVGMTYEV
ncbi:hypothetical protein ACB092_02G053100 [Castanea dentata]